MRVAVTGASGFVGSALMPLLRERGHEAVPIARDDIALTGADAVIHLAGLAHRTGGQAPTEAEFHEANAELPVSVFRAAREAGVPRMIQISTIALLSGHKGPRTEDMPPAPTTAYDRAKARAEAALLAEEVGPGLTIVRPPLVYGPGVKGNMRRLVWLASLPLPLPFASVHNRRSMVGVSNLCDALIFLLDHPAWGIVHVTDDHDLSLRDLVAAIRAGWGRKPGLFSFPPALMRWLVPGRMADQLFGDEPVEMGALPALGWRPPHPPNYDLARMAKAYG